MELNTTEIDILGLIEDGSKYSASAIPLFNADQSMIMLVGQAIWIGILYAKDLVEIDEDDADAIWITITDKGRRAIRTARPL